MNKKIKIMALIVVITTLSTSMVFADDISDAKEQSESIQQEIEDNKAKIEDLENDKKDILSEISSLDSEIQELNGKVDKLNVQISESTTRLEELEQQVEDLKVDLANTKEVMYKRFRAVYQSTGTGYLDLLLNSQSIGDFLNRLETVRILVTYNNDLMNQFKDEQKKLDETLLAVNEEKQSLESAKAVVDADVNTLAQKKREKEDLMAQAESDISTAQAMVDQKEAEFNQILASISSMEEAARQEAERQEAAKQEAANNQSSGGSSSGSSSSSGSGSSSSVSTDGMYRIAAQRYPITSGFVDRINPVTGKQESHKGIDIGAPYGDPVYSLKSGVVSYSGWMTGYGNVVVISHGGGMSTLYAHNSALKVSVGQAVSGGQQIAVVGSTGQSTGPHIHFEVIINGGRIEPSAYYL